MEVYYAEWLEDWRKLVDHEEVDVKVGHLIVMLVRRYDKDRHGHQPAVFTPFRDFDDKVALFSRRTFEVGIRRVLILRGKPHAVLLPGPGRLAAIALSEDAGQGQLLVATEPLAE